MTTNAAKTSPASPHHPVVGVVSSAGGLEALNRLFAAVPPQPGLAFVVVPHLDPARDSLMAELIGRHTRMAVVEATDGMPVAADHVYLIPPNTTLRIRGDVLHLSPPNAATGAAGSLDDFLASLAEDVGARAVGVVLSGTGAHGTRGLRAIKAAGGRTVAQDPASAAFPGMPQAAIDAGVADAVLAPEAIPAFLADLTTTPAAPPAPRPEVPPAGLAAVVDVIKRHTGRDFALYRPGMLTRRIERRTGLLGLPGLPQYLGHLADHPEEIDLLAGDLLIGVSRFFRDAEAFSIVESEVVPAVLRAKAPAADIRVWVPGCATGEEPYSLAMLFLERLTAPSNGSRRVLVFATDIDADSLTFARAGVYSEGSLEALTPERRERFFTPEADRARRVIKPLRDVVVFAPQNVLFDPPFSRLDLISCRNLLIYLEPAAQQRVLAQFAFALSPGGFLFLGPSETLGGQADLFDALPGPGRIFRRTNRATPGRVEPVGPPGDPPRHVAGPPEPPAQPARPAELTAQLLLAEYAPAAALVDSAGQVEYLSGPTTRYLELPPGDLSRDLLALVRDGLRGVTEAALARATQGGLPAPPADAWVRRDGGYHQVRVSVRPVPVHRTPRPCFLVVFEEAGPPAGAPLPAADALMQHLEQELRAAREDLRTTAAASQVAGEDLRAVNEEMISVNEELQSTVEELETSKEELQSLNEELTTTNAQLREKGDALAVVSADVTNLLHSTDLAAVFVGADGRIRRFTPAATQLFRLIPSDVGRPLSDIAHVVLDPTIHDDIQTVLHEPAAPAEREVTGPDERWFLRRALPYRTAEGRTDGVLLTFADVTALKRAELALRRNQELMRLATVLMDSEDAIALAERSGAVSAWNRGAEHLYGYPEREALNLNIAALIPEPRRAADLAALEAVRRGEVIPPWETQRVTRDGRVLDVLVTASLLRTTDGGPPAVSVIERDLSARKRLETELRDRSERTAAILEAVADPVITIDEQGVIEAVNPATERVFGWPAGELVGQPIGVLMPPGPRAEYPEYLARYLTTGLAKVIGIGREVVCLRKDGSMFPADLAVGQVSHLGRFVGIIRDTTERKRLEREVLEIATAEQERIGRELHDSVGQELTGLRLMAETLVAGLRETQSKDLPLGECVSNGLREVLGQVRALSRGLVAAEVDAAGLIPALETLAARVRDSSAVACRFETSGVVHLADATASHLLRIAQEAVANAMRHAQAKTITITLTATDAMTELGVRDDGHGFPSSADQRGGLGLKLMRYRAGLIGAALHIETRATGTFVGCSLREEPLHGPETDSRD